MPYCSLTYYYMKSNGEWIQSMKFYKLVHNFYAGKSYDELYQIYVICKP